jgi:hypothetical protein
MNENMGDLVFAAATTEFGWKMQLHLYDVKQKPFTE